MTENELREELDKLVGSLGKRAAENDADFKDSLDYFKALTAYYALRRKHPDDPSGDDDGFDFTKDIHANGATVPG